MARHALKSGGAAPTILNAANEVAVGSFLAGRIGFLEIVPVIEATLAELPAAAPQSIAEVHALDGEARRAARTVLAGRTPG